MMFAPAVVIAKRRPLIDRGSITRPPLRPLTVVRQCAHFGPLLDRTQCGQETYACKVHGTCSHQQQACLGGMKWCETCTDWKSNERIRFDSYNLCPNSHGERLNPSIIEHQDGYLFAYRDTWGNANISVVRLDRQFRPAGDPVQLELFHRLAIAGREDPRLFRHKGQLHIWYTGWMDGIGDPNKTANVLFARINEESLQVEDIFCPDIPWRNSWEKNHSYFDLNNQTYAIYSIAPHRVMQVECNHVRKYWETQTVTSWSYGHLRGGASPVLHNGEYYHFFHGTLDQGRRLYSLGVAVFEPKPPFKITRITHEPIDVAGHNRQGDCDVLFPGGAMFVDGRWVVAVGIHDRWSEIRFYDEATVEGALTEVP